MANALTVSRLCLIPVIIWLILNSSPLAFLVFGVAALTDFLDGAVARWQNTETELGKILDPLADRLFISGVVLALYLKDLVPPFWALALLVGRDIIIVAGSALLKWRRQPINVTFLGKAATATLLISILLLLAGVSFGLWVFYGGLVLYLGSGFKYLAEGKKLWNSGPEST